MDLDFDLDLPFLPFFASVESGSDVLSAPARGRAVNKRSRARREFAAAKVCTRRSKADAFKAGSHYDNHVL